MYVWSSLWPRSFLRHRTLAVTAVRLFAFCIPVITALPPFDATISAPSSIPLVGWAVDTFMVVVGGWLPLFASAPLLLQVALHASAALPAHPVPSNAPGVLSLHWPPSEMLHRAGPLPCPAANRTFLLIFSSLGGQVPFRAHLAVQTVNLLILATRGTCFCDSKVGGIYLVSMCPWQCLSNACIAA